MSSTPTTNLALAKPAAGDTAWQTPANSNLDVLDALLAGEIYGLTLSTAGSSATFGVAVGAASGMTLASAFTKTTSAWVLGTAAGALDTGAIANSTWYHVYLIQRSDTGVVDILISLSVAAPTMPTNYDRKRRIGSMKTDGSAHWTKFIQVGDEFWWDVFVQDANAVVPGVTTAASVTLTVPTGVQVGAIFSTLIFDASPGMAIIISPLDVSDQTASGSGALSLYDSAATGVALPPIRTNTSAQVRVRVNSVTGTYYINTRGWIDTRGRFG